MTVIDDTTLSDRVAVTVVPVRVEVANARQISAPPG
jgi:hypothetical protein